MTTLALVPVAAVEGVDPELQLLPAIPELIWGLVAFAILMAFMSRFAFPRINALLDERAERIQGQMEAAERERAEAERLRREYERRIAEAQDRANEIVEEARKQGERVRADIISGAEEEAQRILASANEETAAARGRVVADLRRQVAAASVELAGRIVQRELDPDRHRALVDRYIDELSGLN